MEGEPDLEVVAGRWETGFLGDMPRAVQACQGSPLPCTAMTREKRVSSHLALQGLGRDRAQRCPREEKRPSFVF